MIKHVLRSGKEVGHIDGRIIREHEARIVYQILEKINRRKSNDKL